MEDYLKIEFEVDFEYDGERIDKFLALIYPEHSRSFFAKLIKDSLVFVDDNPVSKAGYRLSVDEIVKVLMPPTLSVDILPEDIPLDILYEDDDVIVVNKPKGMVVHPAPGHLSGTLVNALLFHCADSLSGINGEKRPGIVHRIDKDTTGSLIICKNDNSHNSIATQIKEHSCDRIYWGIVEGHLKDKEGTVNANIGRDPSNRLRMKALATGGKTAVTHYKVIEEYPSYDLVEFKLETGRTHQIRAHMASLHHPLAGDTLYGGKPTLCGLKLEGQTLHAKCISFNHPVTNERINIDAKLPEYFEKAISILKE